MTRFKWLIFGLIAVFLMAFVLAARTLASFSDTDNLTCNTMQGSTNGSNPAWIDSNYYYRLPITVNNPYTSAIANYPLRLDVTLPYSDV